MVAKSAQITVTVSPAELTAIRLMCARERVSRAEAARLLITYGVPVYRWWIGAEGLDVPRGVRR